MISRDRHLLAPLRNISGPCRPDWAGLCVLGLALCAVGLDAATSDDAGAEPRPFRLDDWGDDELLIDEVFQSHLPTTLQKYGLRLAVHPHLGDWEKGARVPLAMQGLAVHPHLGDWENKDFMRLTTTVRYGLKENVEISAGSNLHFSHGNGDIRSFDEYGAADLRLGAKFNLGESLFKGWDTGIGFEYDFPLGNPSPELTDGLRHFKPYATFSHRLVNHENRRIFWGIRMNQVERTSLAGEFASNALREGSIGITGGWVIDREQWHYTFEASLDTSRVINSTDEDVFSIRPGVIWEIPTRRDPKVRSNWMVGLALKATTGPGGTSTGASLKLRYSRDLKKPIRKILEGR